MFENLYATNEIKRKIPKTTMFKGIFDVEEIEPPQVKEQQNAQQEVFKMSKLIEEPKEETFLESTFGIGKPGLGKLGEFIKRTPIYQILTEKPVREEPALVFEVGEGLTEEQKQKAEEIVRKERVVPEDQTLVESLFLPEPLSTTQQKLAVAETLGEKAMITGLAALSLVPVVGPGKAPKGVKLGKEAVEELTSSNIFKGAKDVAANIKLDKFNTSDDVLKQIKKSVENVELKKIPNKELQVTAEQLDLEPQKLINKYKRNKILTKEEAFMADRLALEQAREVVNIQKKINASPGNVEDYAQLEKALTLNKALSEMAAGNRREAGQLVQQYRMMRDILNAEDRNLKSIMKIFGDDFNKISDKLAKVDLNDIRDVAKFIQKEKQVGFMDKLYEFWINGLLSAPSTHLINTVGNTLYSLTRPVITGTAAGLDWITTGAGKLKPRSVYFGEAAADIYGMKQGLKEGVAKAAKIMKDGLDFETITKLEDIRIGAIKGRKGEIIRLPGRFLAAMDEFYKPINHTAVMNSLAYKDAIKSGKKTIKEISQHIAEIKKNPSLEMLEKASTEARRYVFQKELGKAGQALMKIRRDVPGATIIMPFLRTPVNILKEGVSLTPLNFLSVLKRGISKEERLEQAARATIGSFITAGIYDGVIDGNVTGAAPANVAERDAFYREGKQPYSFKVGDKWISYGRFEPFATAIGFTADAAEAAKEENNTNALNLMAAAATSFASTLQDKTFLRGISEIFNTIQNINDYGTLKSAERYLNRLAASTVPSIVYSAARIKDEVIRRPEGLKETFMARLPGLSEKITPRRNAWGEVIKRDNRFSTATGIYMSTAKNDVIDEELKNLGYVVGFPPKTIKLPAEIAEPLKIPENNRNISLTNEEYDKLLKVTGKLQKKLLEKMFESKNYKELDYLAKEEVINDIVTQTRRTVKGYLLTEIILGHKKELKSRRQP